MEIKNSNLKIAFNAKFGPNLTAYLAQNDFEKSLTKVKVFEKQFSDKFVEYLDENTILDLNKRNRLEIFNPNFSKIKMPLNIKLTSDFAKTILKQSQWLYNRAECVLFERIISSQIFKGKTFEQLRNFAQNSLSSPRRDYFEDTIVTAERILKENPSSKLTEYDYSRMRDIQLREFVESPEFQELMSKRN